MKTSHNLPHPFWELIEWRRQSHDVAVNFIRSLLIGGGWINAGIEANNVPLALRVTSLIGILEKHQVATEREKV